MRRLLLVVLVTALVAAGASVGAAQPSQAVFVLSGGGWGHGVGMSQWGAYGQAKAGRSYEQILAYYYRGTTLGPPSVQPPKRIRVLVADGLDAVTVTAPTSIVVATGGKRRRAGEEVTVGANLVVTPQAHGGVPSHGAVTLRPTSGAHLTVSGKAYRGDLVVTRAAGTLQLVNLVGLEPYLLGVVPGEMPKDWPLAALEAQAVAARTYALSNLVEGKSFDLYSDWRSQVYYGVGAEAPGPTQAVRATRGQTLSFDGAPADTFYFSSSGGRTISALDAFGQDVPYLVSVDDPWDATSPKHQWETQVLGGAELARRLGLQGVVSDVTFEPGVPGTPAALRLTTGGGHVVSVSLADMRDRLGLDSLDFQLGMLRLDRPSPGARAGAMRLTGVARAVADPILERQLASGKWARAKRISPTADGLFTITIRPGGTTTYRLSAGGVAGPTVTVRAPT